MKFSLNQKSLTAIAVSRSFAIIAAASSTLIGFTRQDIDRSCAAPATVARCRKYTSLYCSTLVSALQSTHAFNCDNSKSFNGENANRRALITNNSGAPTISFDIGSPERRTARHENAAFSWRSADILDASHFKRNRVRDDCATFYGW